MQNPFDATTIYGGIDSTAGGGADDGADSIFGTRAKELIFGGGGADTILGWEATDTISGGSGNDVFAYTFFGNPPMDDGNNAAGGGPVELITDVNWAEDKFNTVTKVTFAANVGAPTGANLNASANNAVAAAFALAGGGGTTVVAAQFTFGGRIYLAIEQTVGNAVFDDATDLLLDITGATGTISASNFI